MFRGSMPEALIAFFWTVPPSAAFAYAVAKAADSWLEHQREQSVQEHHKQALELLVKQAEHIEERTEALEKLTKDTRQDVDRLADQRL